MKMNNAVALVTGANRGIGKVIVGEILARGARRVYAAARDPASLEPLVALDRDRVVPLRIDVTAPDQIEAAVQRAPDVTVLVNNAGVLCAYNLLTTPPGDLERQFATNFFGTLAMIRAFLPTLERAQGAAIVNVLSILALGSVRLLAGYATSKAALFSLTQALRAELRSKLIDVHGVFPGPVDTDMLRGVEIPKATVEEVGLGIVEGIERGDEDICTDVMSRQIVAAWKTDPKGVERHLGSM